MGGREARLRDRRSSIWTSVVSRGRVERADSRMWGVDEMDGGQRRRVRCGGVAAGVKSGVVSRRIAGGGMVSRVWLKLGFKVFGVNWGVWGVWGVRDVEGAVLYFTGGGKKGGEMVVVGP